MRIMACIALTADCDTFCGNCSLWFMKSKIRLPQDFILYPTFFYFVPCPPFLQLTLSSFDFWTPDDLTLYASLRQLSTSITFFSTSPLSSVNSNIVS
jgi:hypothetical protein